MHRFLRHVSDDEPLLRIGQRLGRYTILAPRRSGVEEALFAAYDHELERCVAIKLRCSIEPVDSSEAMAMAQLSHPAMAAIYDVGVYRDLQYIVMELVDGATLRRWLADARPPWRAVARVAIDIAHGLAAFHQAGFVHDDIRPDTILVDASGRARLANVGRARRAGTGVAPHSDRVGFCATFLEVLPVRPRLVREVMMRGLATQPRDGHPSMQHLATELERATARTPGWGIVIALGLLGLAVWMALQS
jgi:serine/threonine protein kinase